MKKVKTVLVAVALAGLLSLAFGDCYKAVIVKPAPFHGNKGDIFKLNDRSIWEVTYGWEYMYEYRPDVIICPSDGELIIKGKKISVKKVY